MAALDDIQRFHQQKVVDLRNILLQHAQMQKVRVFCSCSCILRLTPYTHAHHKKAYAMKQIAHWRLIKNAASQ